MNPDPVLAEALRILDLHYRNFASIEPLATKTEHPVPCDTRAWSQILATVLCGVPGKGRKKGPDLADGSDVKAANAWHAIDKPRFNGVIKAGTKASTSGKLASLDVMPWLFFVLWDERAGYRRCRTWVVRPPVDAAFRTVCARWYQMRDAGTIGSNNLQFHPPIGSDLDVTKNNCGHLKLPLLLSTRRPSGGNYEVLAYDPKVLREGQCVLV